MTKLEELMIEQRKTKLEMTKDRYIRTGIIYAYLDEHPRDLSIHSYFRQHRKLREAICVDHRWEPSYNGFVTRTNFKFDEQANEITFDTHKITKQGDSYIHDPSNEAIERFITHKEDFEALAKVDKIIAKYHYLYQERVDDGLDTAMKFFETFYPDRLEVKLSMTQKHNELFFYFYGEVGKDILVRWLNKLNKPYKIEKLVEEFNNDVNKAKEYLELSESPEYSKSKRLHLEFERVLLLVIERYSPRGRELSIAYRKLLNKGNNNKIGL